MSVERRIEASLARVLEDAAAGGPPHLAEAVRYAVFPGGARLRPTLLLAVAAAEGDKNPLVADAAAAAIELVHCASLVHDDLPCFDDADTRRGRPSVHVRYGEATALLVGDGLIIAAFEALSRGTQARPDLLPHLTLTLARASGIGRGIVAGQAWESAPHIDVAAYHRAKTAALFEAATVLGATAAGADGERWRSLGTLVGMAYQAADDLADTAGQAAWLGKPVGQDATHERPSKVRELGVQGALRYLRDVLDEMEEAVPACPGQGGLRAWLATAVVRLVPQELRQRVA